MFTIFGIMSVYLQGKGAIMDFGVHPDHLEGWIGGKESGIKILDYRRTTLLYCHPKTSHRDLSPLTFADIFNLPAKIQLDENDDGTITIVLQPTIESDIIETRRLWLGVIWNQKLPVQKFEWLTLKPVTIEEQSVTAFASVIEWQEK